MSMSIFAPVCACSAGFLWQQAVKASSILDNISIWTSTPSYIKNMKNMLIPNNAVLIASQNRQLGNYTHIPTAQKSKRDPRPVAASMSEKCWVTGVSQLGLWDLLITRNLIASGTCLEKEHRFQKKLRAPTAMTPNGCYGF